MNSLMLSAKPEGCQIEEKYTPEGCILSWPQPSGGIGRYFAAAFIAFWLCGWAFGWIMATGQLLVNGPHLFLIAWLGGWTVGGIMAMVMLYQLLRPSSPESVTLGLDSFRHDPGRLSAGVYMFGGWSRQRDSWEIWRQFFRTRKPVNIPKQELKTIVLERVGERQRLRYDFGAERIEIGKFLREPEREWLAQIIQEWQSA